MDNNSSRNKRFYSRYGPWAVVTGASSGIGRALAVRIAEAGVNLVLVARSQSVLAQIASELSEKNDIECRVVAADLASEGGVDLLLAATRELEVGLLVEAAGFGTSGLFIDSPLDREFDMLNVNCRALMALSWHFGRRFAEQGRGGMILLSSIVGFQGMPHAAHYAATKAYVTSFSEALRIELRGHGITVLAVCPGPVHTGFGTAAQRSEREKKIPGRECFYVPKEQVVEESLAALWSKRARIYPGLKTAAVAVLISAAPIVLLRCLMSFRPRKAE